MDRGGWQATVHGVEKSRTRSTAHRSMCRVETGMEKGRGTPVDGQHPQRGGGEEVGGAEGDSQCSGWLKGQLLQ